MVKREGGASRVSDGGGVCVSKCLIRKGGRLCLVEGK